MQSNLNNPKNQWNSNCLCPSSQLNHVYAGSKKVYSLQINLYQIIYVNPFCGFSEHEHFILILGVFKIHKAVKL